MNTLDYTEYDKIIAKCRALSQHKNALYGTESLKLFGGMAILSRINDKVQRMNNMADTKIEMNESHTDESFGDTIDDLINYAIYLRMLTNGKLETEVKK